MKVELNDVLKILSAVTSILLASAEVLKQINQRNQNKNDEPRPDNEIND